MAKTERETFYNLAIADAEGNVTTSDYVSEGKKETIEKELGDKGTLEVTKVQSFIITEAESLDEAATLFPQRALEFLNYGARLAQQNVRRDLMRDEDWAGIEGDFDLLPEVQEPKERKKASPRDKVINLLSKLAKEAGKDVDRSAIEAMLAQFMPQGDAAAPSA